MASFQRLLITGGAGFIGSAFVRHRLACAPSTHIRVLDVLTYAGDRNHLNALAGDVEFIEGDIANESTVAAALHDCDGVVHLAAESHVDRSVLNAAPFEHTNVHGTSVLLNAAMRAGVRRFLYVSTDEVYGDTANTQSASKETDPLRPGNAYAKSKTQGEQLVASAIKDGLDCVITRGANTCGPRQYPEKIVPLFITNALLGLPLPVYGDGSAVRDYLHVDDHCAGINCALEHATSGGVYNLGNNLQVSCGSVAQHILDLIKNTGACIEHVPDRPGHDMRYAVDSSNAKHLGWTPKYDFNAMLMETAQWYAKNETWWRAIRNTKHFQAHFKAWYVDRQS
jgi:dTDP-glucose 4,6-dehydratase